MAKDTIKIYENAVVIRSHNKQTIVADHPKLENCYHIELTKKYDKLGSGPVKFVRGRRKVHTILLALSFETMEELIIAHTRLKKRK